jgi:hypothetical protein
MVIFNRLRGSIFFYWVFFNLSEFSQSGSDIKKIVDKCQKKKEIIYNEKNTEQTAGRSKCEFCEPGPHFLICFLSVISAPALTLLFFLLWLVCF